MPYSRTHMITAIACVVIVIIGLLSGPVLYGMGFFFPSVLISSAQSFLVGLMVIGLTILLFIMPEAYEGNPSKGPTSWDFWVPICIVFFSAWHVIVMGQHAELPEFYETANWYLGWFMLGLSCLMTLAYLTKSLWRRK